MTIQSSVSKIAYTGSGTTGPFSIPWLFYSNTDIVAITTVTATGAQTTLVLNTDYTLTNTGTAVGNSLTLTSSLAATSTITIYLDPPLLQLSDYVSGAAFPSATIEQDFDRDTQVAQRLKQQIINAIRAPDAETAPNMVLPAKILRSNKYQVFDSNGDVATSAGSGTDTGLRTDLINALSLLVGSSAISYKQTAAELAATVTPVNLYIPDHTILGYVHAGRYGCSSASSDNSTAITNAISVAKAVQSAFGVGYGNMTVHLGVGIFKHASALAINGSNQGIIFSGELGAMAQGGARPATTLRFTGGAVAQLTVSNATYTEIHNINFENSGTATCAVEYDNTVGRIRLYRCTVQDVGLTAYSTAFININNPAAYNWFEHCEFNGGATTYIKYDGHSSGSSGTTIEFKECIADQNTNNTIFFALNNGNFKLISMHNNTFNQQANNGTGFTIIDMTNVGAFQCFSFSFRDNEIDSSVPPAAQRSLKLVNVMSGDISGGTWNFGGAPTAAVSLTNSVICAGEIQVKSISGPVFEMLDSISRVFPRPMYLTDGNTVDITAATSGNCGMVDVTYSSAMDIFGHLGNPGAETTHRITVTNGAAMTVSMAKSTNGVGHISHWARGQKVRILFRNTSGGVMGAVTFDANFKTSGAFTVPANGFSRNIIFEYDGTNLIELSRTILDVAN